MTITTYTVHTQVIGQPEQITFKGTSEKDAVDVKDLTNKKYNDPCTSWITTETEEKTTEEMAEAVIEYQEMLERFGHKTEMIPEMTDHLLQVVLELSDEDVMDIFKKMEDIYFSRID